MFIDSEQFSPIRPPDWRYRKVCRLIDATPPKRPGRCDDSWVVGYHKFRRALAQLPDADDYASDILAYKDPGLWWAQQLRENENSKTQHICLRMKARLLAGQSPEHIAKCVGTIASTVTWYSRLFFDIQDRLMAGDWVAEHILIPAYMSQQQPTMVAVPSRGNDQQLEVRPAAYDPFYDASLLFYAYYAGADFLDALLSHRNAGVTSAWLDDHFVSLVKQRSTSAVARVRLDDDENAFKLIHINTALRTVVKNEQSKPGAVTQGTFGSPKLVEKLLTIISDGVAITAGEDGKHAIENTPVAKYDEGSAELRDNELSSVIEGRVGPDILDLKMPPSGALGSVEK